MRILIDIGHPAHVHLFRNLAVELQKRGHIVYYSIRDISIVKHLMDAYSMNYYNLGQKRKSLLGKAFAVIVQDYKLYRFIKNKRIDLGISSGISLPHISKITNMKSFTFDDDDDNVEPLFVKYGHPFSDIIVTPDVITRKAKRVLNYMGTHELAYLHPNVFVPDRTVLEKVGIKESEHFFIMRFVAFHGHHDVGQYGLTLPQKKRLIELLQPYGRVLITSESKIEPDLERYRVPVLPEDIHSLMAYATLLIGDSQTMISEAAILGVPALKCNTFAGKLSVPNELESKYGLCYAYHPKDFDKFYAHLQSLLQKKDLKQEWLRKRERLLSDKINVTAFWIWFIENYPESLTIMQKTPDFQNRFR